jgi:tRNA C32,U32 (ribose-2'-O)-methylase TrmJ
MEPKKKRTIGKIEKEKLFNFFSDLLDEINYPEHKKEKTKIMFKRIMGRQCLQSGSIILLWVF